MFSILFTFFLDSFCLFRVCGVCRRVYILIKYLLKMKTISKLIGQQYKNSNNNNRYGNLFDFVLLGIV